MANTATQEPMWTEKKLIARAEGIAAHWRKDVGECNVFDLSRASRRGFLLRCISLRFIRLFAS